MKRIDGEDILSIICTISIVITSVVIILTFLSTYYFINTMPWFDTYLPLQICISISMFMLAIRFYIYRNGIIKYTYSITCFIIAIISLLFSLNLIM